MDNKNVVKSKLKKILLTYDFIDDDFDILDDTLIFEDLGIDSITFISIICDIESEFLIKFSEEDLIFKDDLRVIDMINNIIELSNKIIKGSEDKDDIKV